MACAVPETTDTTPSSAALDPGLLRALRALVDPTRLRICGLLADRPSSIDELAATLALPLRAIARHLEQLRDAGLIETVAPAPPGRDGIAATPIERHRLAPRRIGELGRALAAVARDVEPKGGIAPGPGGRPRPAAEAKVLRSFFEDGRLMTIPAHDRKRLVILRYLAETVFAEDREYPEKEVNQLLALRHPDVASLRRYLVDSGFMRRDAGRYRVRPVEEWPPSTGD